jgi:hypothetical protein
MKKDVFIRQVALNPGPPDLALFFMEWKISGGLSFLLT